LIHPSTPDKWIAFMRGSLARTLASLESRQVYLRAPDQVFTEKSCVSLASFDRDSCSWKTYQQSLVTGWEPFSETWPRWGMTQGGSAYAHPMSERRITETDGFYLPTPTVTSGAQVAWDKTPGQTGGTTLAGWVRYWPTPSASHSETRPAKTWNPKSQSGRSLGCMAATGMWPTPTAHNAKETGAASQMNRKTVQLGDMAGGQLNPTWVEWLMQFPIGFTVLRDWAMPKSRSKPQPHGDCSEGRDA
jgi:hypothetical protein